MPGVYGVVETPPSGYIVWGAIAGQVNGSVDGTVTSESNLTAITVQGGDNSVQNDFALVRPITLNGNVYYDQNNNSVYDLGEQGIGGATVQVQYVPTLGTAPPPVNVTTQADGSWSVSGQRRAIRGLAELVSGYLQGSATAGTVNGTVDGTAQNPGETVGGIALLSGQAGQNYNFGELLPASVSGYVYVDANNDGIFEATETPIAAQITLLDASGNPTGLTTTTDASGFYQFENLLPGTYAVAATQPAGYYRGSIRRAGRRTGP